MAQFLIERGAQIDAVDDSGSTALRFAAWERKGDVVALLLDCKANPDKAVLSVMLSHGY